MKRKITSCLLALVLALGLALPTLAEDSAGQILPAVGEQLEGFTVRELGTFDLLSTPTVLFEHDKTGALVYYIAAQDVNRSFDITFRTPALNSHGTPHVFEHITISGSDKYPSTNLFFPMISQTYNTFINAMTMWNSTTYPLSSLSEEQLLKLMDVYLDGVFNPLLYQDERLFRREAWRYELADADDELTITGTVYNEMKGARTISRVADENLAKLLYPDSLQGNDSGGDPAVIPELTYQELLDFHGAYYHPSNALVILYGDIDLARFLNLLDGEYFSKYDRKDIEVPNGDIPAQTEYVTAEFAYPVEQGAQTEAGSFVRYGFVANGAGIEDEMGLNVLTSVLSHQASPLQEAARERLPGASIDVAIAIQHPQTELVFSGVGVNREDADTVKQIVDDVMAQIATDGLDPELVQAVIASNRFAMLTIPESSDLGTSLSPSIASVWARNGNIEYFNDYLAQLERLQGLGDDTSVYTDLIERYVLSNDHAALAVTYPEPGLAEQQAAELAQKLSDYKASLSEEGVQALIDATEEMADFSAEEAPLEMIKSLQAVTVETLPEETETYEIQDETRDGVRYVTAPTQVGDISMTQITLDTSWVPAQDLHTLVLYTHLVGQLDTEQHTKEELALLNTRYLNGLAVAAGQLELPGKLYRPALMAQWMGLMDEYADGIDLVHEMLFETKFDDVEAIQNAVMMDAIGLRQMASTAPYVYQMSRASAVFTTDGAYSEYTSGLEYYYGLQAIAEQLEEDPQVIIDKLEAMQEALKNKADALVIFTGNDASVKTFEGEIGAFFEGMDDTAREAASLDALPRPALREALVVDSPVQYNMVFATLEELGIEESGVLTPASQILYDAYLTPKLRHGLGAYDTLTFIDADGILICSYRDPGLTETYAVYDGMADYIATAEMEQEDIDRYIISAYSGYATPQGTMSGAMDALSLYIAGRPADEKLTRMREMKAMTIEDLRALAPVLEKLVAEGAKSTAGGATVIEANKDLFDEVLRVE